MVITRKKRLEDHVEGSSADVQEDLSRECKRLMRAYEVAHLYYEEGMSQREIAHKLGLGYNSRISQFLKIARDEKIVRIKVEPPNCKIVEESNKEIEKLEKELTEKFKLASVLLVKNDEKGNDTTEIHHQVHQKMGIVLGAKKLKEIIEVMPNLHIGVTGGEAVFKSIKSVCDSFSTKLPYQAKIRSLVGNASFRAGEPTTHGVNFVDGDDVAKLLASIYKTPEVITVNYPIACGKEFLSASISEEENKRIFDEFLDTLFWSENSPLRIPQVAVVGIGALHQDHRYFQLDGEIASPDVKPIENELNELKHSVQDIENRTGYIVVGIWCLRLFYVEPPGGLEIKEEEKRRIKDLIKTVNERLIAVDDNRLSLVNLIVAIGGGPKEHLAVWGALQKMNEKKKDKRLIDVLCTDEMAAKKLIAWYDQDQIAAKY